MQLDADGLSKLCDKLSDYYGYEAERIFTPEADGKLIPLNPYKARQLKRYVHLILN